MKWTWAGVGALVLLGLWCALVLFAPAWFVSDAGPGSGLSVAERLRAENDVRSLLLQSLAGLVALSGIAVGAVASFRQVKVNREGQFVDLFTKAVELLADDAVAVRQGGVYAMEQISAAAPHYRGHVAALLATFVRQQAPWPPRRPQSEVEAVRVQWHGGLSDDVGAAMAALGRRSMILPGTGIELERVDLRAAELSGLDFSDFCFVGANLEGVLLRECNLSRVNFGNANLRSADLRGAQTSDMNLAGADLQDALLDQDS